MSWRYQGWRHSLAAKGVRTSYVGKKGQIVNKKYKSNLYTTGVPTSQGLNRAYNGMDEKPDREEVESFLRAARLRRHAKNQVEEDLLADREYSDDKLMATLEEEETPHKKRASLAHIEGHKETFGEGVKQVLLHPVSDLNGDWKAYEETAGHQYQEPSSAVEKAQNAGAALVGRVVTLQNVEPMIDYEKDRSWRDSIVDIEFGRDRRTAMSAKVDSEKYNRWKRLVNMSPSQLKSFMNEYGDEAGLSRSEASKQGIKSGRDSARAIIRMKQKGKENWNDNDVEWMNRQISFVSRMKGAKGPLYDEKGRPTRKLLALKVWGHDPNK